MTPAPAPPRRAGRVGLACRWPPHGSACSAGAAAALAREGYRKRDVNLRDLVEVVAGWLPAYTLYVVGDGAYVGKHLLKGLPDNAHVLGPIHWKAGLSKPLPAGSTGVVMLCLVSEVPTARMTSLSCR